MSSTASVAKNHMLHQSLDLFFFSSLSLLLLNYKVLYRELMFYTTTKASDDTSNGVSLYTCFHHYPRHDLFAYHFDWSSIARDWFYRSRWCRSDGASCPCNRGLWRMSWALASKLTWCTLLCLVNATLPYGPLYVELCWEMHNEVFETHFQIAVTCDDKALQTYYIFLLFQQI